MAESMKSMVALLREARGWNQTTLATESSLSQAVISRLEAGTLELSADKLSQVARALDCPPEVLEADPSVPGIEITCLHHRRRSSTMTVSTMKRIEAVTHLTRISVEGLLEGIDAQPQFPFHKMPATDENTPAVIAQALRASWRIPPGPIRNVLNTVEAAGVIVVARKLGSAGQDAVSTWPSDSTRPPMMIVNEGLSADRLRFTVAHELGHLVMHVIPGDRQEDEANVFAGEFLAPADEIREDLRGLRTGDFRRLAMLKTRWGMSMAALIRRAHDLGEITDRQYREFYVRLGRLGWRTSEPGDVELETPSSVRRIIDLHRTVHHYEPAKLAALAGMNEPAFRRNYLGEEAPATMPKTPLTLGVEND